MSIWLPKAIVKAELAKNVEDAKDLIEKGLVKLDNEVTFDQTCILVPKDTIMVDNKEIQPTIKISVEDESVDFLVPRNKTKKK